MFNTKKESTVSFMLKDAGYESFEVDRVNGQDAIMVENGKRPTATQNHGNKVVDGVTYHFDGWYLDSECTNRVNPTEYELQGPTTFYGRYLPGTAVPYTITYSGLEGASVTPVNRESYTVNDTFTLYNPTKPGYTFLGWTGTGLGEASIYVTVPRGSTGDRRYTATREAQTDLSYTVNYLDEDTGAAIRDPKTVDGQTFEDVVRAADEVAAIDGYTYTRCDPAELTIADENNVINLYYSVDRMGENGQPDGIPDKYQIVVTYDVTNGSASFTSRVLTKRVGGTDAPSADGFAVLTADAIPSFRAWGDNYGNGGWLSAGAVVGTQLTSDTTYRYGFAYLPADPGGTEIEDPEVPLASASGLNDTEHFAYILL